MPKKHRTINVQEGTYKQLCAVLGKLQILRKKPQSFDSTIKFLLVGFE